ncbi:MAG TPA: lysylphosphatidylglycerol synthase domain-containing protein [Polyangia bacterium]|nr:lysylphosphatidylglycerol synthase domain-containing protein [Polyangia bacterium]
MRKKLGRILPWLVAIGLFAYLLSRFSPAEVAHNIRIAAGWTVPAIVGLVLLVYVADSFAIWKTFGWFVARLSFKEVLVVRGATYLLAVVNYALGQGAIVYFVNRSRGVPVSRGTAAVLLVMGINVLVLLALASLGLLFVPGHDRRLGLVVAVAYAGLLVYVVLVLAKPRFLTSKPIFDVLLAARLTDYLKAMAARIPHLLSLMILTYTSMRAFHIVVPLGQAVLCLPMVYFVAVLPITPLGLGTTEFMMTTFFAKYAPGGSGAAVVASSMALRAIAIVVQCLLGFVCLKTQLAKDIAPPAEAEASA